MLIASILVAGASLVAAVTIHEAGKVRRLRDVLGYKHAKQQADQLAKSKRWEEAVAATRADMAAQVEDLKKTLAFKPDSQKALESRLAELEIRIGLRKVG